MTSRVNYAPQDFLKMCDQAERDHESKKLIILLNRVKKQIAARKDAASSVELPKRPVAVLSGDFGSSRPPSRSAPFER